MTDPFLAEVRMFGGNFAPTGWALCNGQLMSISQNTALFSLLGTTYGGDGRVTFGLPNLMGSVPLQQGQGQGLSSRSLGQSGGASSVVLQTTEMPSHTHAPNAYGGTGDSGSPTGREWGQAGYSKATLPLYATSDPDTTMHPAALAPAGGSQPHNNMPPYLTVTFIIALQGIFPQRP